MVLRDAETSRSLYKTGFVYIKGAFDGVMNEKFNVKLVPNLHHCVS